MAAAGCGPVGPVLPADHESDDEPEATVSSAVTTCYCPAPYTCQHSSSPSYMYPAAHDAMLRAGVTDASLVQTFGDAAASVGTHCPEPGVRYSAATDFTQGSAPCSRVHALRMQGFAAWYRVPPSFGYHIHAVYAGTPSLKQSLKDQLASFAQGRNGLANNAIETVCPITTEEKAAVARVKAGLICVPGGAYCGGDKVKGDANTLYKCNADGLTTTVIKVCTAGCSVNSGTDDSCKAVTGGSGGGSGSSGGGSGSGGGKGGG
ncbi:MAG: hypothetical protein K1X89_04180, partial [Myxococcaceae bacterium]|nr:hypothetical protein [Myxococcaceae bacterium]